MCFLNVSSIDLIDTTSNVGPTGLELMKKEEITFELLHIARHHVDLTLLQLYLFIICSWDTPLTQWLLLL